MWRAATFDDEHDALFARIAHGIVTPLLKPVDEVVHPKVRGHRAGRVHRPGARHRITKVLFAAVQARRTAHGNEDAPSPRDEHPTAVQCQALARQSSGGEGAVMTPSHPNSEPPETNPGLEPAIAVSADQPASQVLATLRETGVNLAVVMGADGRPHRVVPYATLAKSPAGHPAGSCEPAWPAATFHEPTTPEARQRNTELWLSGGCDPPAHGSRTIVMRGNQIMGLIPVPGLLNRPGPATRLLERALASAAGLITKNRH